jgi:ATP-dependent Clp protease adapter protein ClpS
MKFSEKDYMEKITNIKNGISDTVAEPDVDVETLNDMLTELGIKSASEENHKLILWNDHVNDMISVIVALYEVCGLSNEESMKVMMEAHENGKAVAKKGSFDELKRMKNLLNKRNLEVTIEE